MKKLFISLIIVTVLLAPIVLAQIMTIPVNDKAEENARAPGLEKFVFIHYKKGYGKPPGTPGRGSPTECYKLLGVKWKAFPVNYVINPTNPQNLPVEFVTSAISISAETWDTATTSTELFGGYSVDDTASAGVQNYKNEISWGNYPETGVIAATTVWYSPIGRKIVEFDIMFDTDWIWGDATIDSTKMDLQNIATHELGHGAGLGDVYDSACSAVTMYGYSNYGETQKRTLEQPDITGIQTLYGI